MPPQLTVWSRMHFDSLYPELHRLARRELNRRGRPNGGLGATTVLHEAYIRMSGRDGAAFVDHARFMGYMARVMRADHRRSAAPQSQRRGDCSKSLRSAPTTRTTSRVTGARGNRRCARRARQGRAGSRRDRRFEVFLRILFTDIAVMRGTSERTIQRRWEKARLYLHHAIGDAPHPHKASCRHSALTAGARSARSSTRRWRSPTANGRPGWRPFARATRSSRPICSRCSRSTMPWTSRVSWRAQFAGAGHSAGAVARGTDPRRLPAGLTHRSGGMGSVWLAERCDGRFEGRAAVKLLNIALVGRAGEERFRREGTISPA